MLRIKPFAAIRPKESNASRVASVPYDVVSTEQARQLAGDNPCSFLHVIRPEIDLPDSTSPYDEAVYTKGRENLEYLLRECEMVQENSPRVYLYRQVMNHRAQIGLVCCCHIDDYANNLIRKHEHTRPEKENDRTRHVLTLNANTGPVFLTYRDEMTLNELIERDINDRPLFHFNSPDKVTHTVWTINNPQPYIEAFAQMPVAYVADGHHRAASAGRAGGEKRAANAGHDGEEEYNWFLSVLFPASQLTILPYNRVVSDLNGQTPAEVLTKLQAVATVTKTTDPQPEATGSFCVYFDGDWHRVEIDASTIDTSDAVKSLDVALLQDRVLEPILGIADPRTDERIDFVGGIHGPEELARRVDSGEAAIAFSLFATSIEQLMAVADAGRVMPPKSTWFEPKLRSGLFVHSLD